MESFANWPNKYSIDSISFVAFVFPNWEPWQRVVPGQPRRDLRDWPHGAKVSPGKTRNGHLAPNGSNFSWQKDWTPLEKIIKHNTYSGGLRNKAWESASWASAEQMHWFRERLARRLGLVAKISLPWTATNICESQTTMLLRSFNIYIYDIWYIYIWYMIYIYYIYMIYIYIWYIYIYNISTSFFLSTFCASKANT